MGNLLSKRRSKRSRKKRRKHGNDLHNDEAFETEHATFEGTFLNCSFETRNPSQVEITPEGNLFLNVENNGNAPLSGCMAGQRIKNNN